MALVAVLAASGLIAGAGLTQAAQHGAKPTKPVRTCRRRHHRRVCTQRRRKPRHVGSTTTTTATTTTSTSTSTSTSTATSSTTTTETSTTSQIQTQTTATQTTTSSTTQAALPHGTEVDETATGESSPVYALTPYEPTLAAGSIRFNIYNFDQDSHTFAVANAQGREISPTYQVPAGEPGTPIAITVKLPPGTYVLYCTLPQHAALGMRSTIVVK